jgi:hypothetical protein
MDPIDRQIRELTRERGRFKDDLEDFTAARGDEDLTALNDYYRRWQEPADDDSDNE